MAKEEMQLICHFSDQPSHHPNSSFKLCSQGTSLFTKLKLIKNDSPLTLQEKLSVLKEFFNLTFP